MSLASDEPGAFRGISERDVTIRGNATPEDVAAVLATLRELAQRAPAVNRYELWRSNRLAALRRLPPR
jgi:hypothetical protein